MSGPYGYGGGLFSSGTVVLTGSAIHDNLGYFAGGDIYNFGALAMTNSQVYSNAGQFGGGLANERGVAMVIDSMVYSNTATHGIGGGLENTGSLSMTNDQIFSNAADFDRRWNCQYGFLRPPPARSMTMWAFTVAVGCTTRGHLPC